MSLRAARSLPSLRNAFQQSAHQAHIVPPPSIPPLPRANVKQFSTSNQWNASSKQPRTGNLVMSRNVHQTSQKKSTLLSSSNVRYNSMNLQALKMECRSRKLKVSGKKLELIQRLNSFDESKLMMVDTGARHLMSSSTEQAKEVTKKQLKDFQKVITRKLSSKNVGAPAENNSVKAFSTTSSSKAKGDDSHIDYLRFPSSTELQESQPEPVSAPSLLPKDPVKNIDIVETKTKISEMEGAVSVGPDNEGEVHVFENIFKHFKIDEAAGVTESLEPEAEEIKYEPSKEEVNSKDKGILLGIFAGALAWWSLKPKDKASN